MRRSLLIAILAVSGLAVPKSMVSQEVKPDDLWVNVYGWLQTGERLADAELWPLALGSFIESHRQIESLSKTHPGFEPEMLEYRLEQLEQQIAGAQEKLQPGENEIMQKYLDFIDSYEEGLRLRFENQFVDSLNTLDIAKVLLDEIIFEKPDEFREAVETQYQLLHESLEWLDSQINFKQRARPAVFVGDGVEWGTTEFVKVEHLPADGEDVLVEGSLFPGVIAQSSSVGETSTSTEVPGSEKEEEEEENTKYQSGIRGFRMSSKQKEVPELPKTEGELRNSVEDTNE